MEIQKDFKEFIELLNGHNVQYLIVGGYAVSFYSKPKFTNDLDIWIRPIQDNAEKMLDVLKGFGFGDLELTVEDFTSQDNIIQLGVAPLRIDLLTSVSGLQFDQAYSRKIEADYFGVKASIISFSDILENKRKSGRKKDIDDLAWIKKYGRGE